VFTKSLQLKSVTDKKTETSKIFAPTKGVYNAIFIIFPVVIAKICTIFCFQTVSDATFGFVARDAKRVKVARCNTP